MRIYAERCCLPLEQTPLSLTLSPEGRGYGSRYCLALKQGSDVHKRLSPQSGEGTYHARS